MLKHWEDSCVAYQPCLKDWWSSIWSLIGPWHLSLPPPELLPPKRLRSPPPNPRDQSISAPCRRQRWRRPSRRLAVGRGDVSRRRHMGDGGAAAEGIGRRDRDGRCLRALGGEVARRRCLGIRRLCSGPQVPIWAVGPDWWFHIFSGANLLQTVVLLFLECHHDP